MNAFANNENINLLWEILLDELHINPSNKQLLLNVKNVFDNNLTKFVAKYNSNTNSNTNVNIMMINKQFLSQVIQSVNLNPVNLNPVNLNPVNLNPVNLNPVNNFKRINIGNEIVVGEPYKIEDIQLERKNDFDKEFEKKKLELETYMMPKKPHDVNFLIDNNDVKIKEMGYLLSEKLAQRNLEIEQFTQHNNLLKETHKKVSFNNNDININNVINVNDINDNDINDNDINNDNIKEEEQPFNIFDKLKKQQLTKEPNYIQQPSIPLEEFNMQPFNNGNANNGNANNGNANNGNANNGNANINDPILPKTEIIKQLNEMNIKIDKLYNIINQLTNLLTQKEEKNE
jgi:hypothetical protein